MKTPIHTSSFHRPVSLALLALCTFAIAPLPAQTADELEKLKGTVEQLQKNIDDLNSKIRVLQENQGTNALLQASPSMQVLEKVAEGQTVGARSPVTYRGALDDKQQAASRPGDFTLDPEYRGFIPVPNTPVLIKFNAKPHLDAMTDNRNAGSDHRFVPALFPLQGDPDYDGDQQSTLSANASQLRLDVRAPEMAGNIRFYYQNDFFGDDTRNMRYRLQHLYGQIYGFKGGFTYGVWEDPDTWPDTVDYEGPNGLIFSRRPVAQYTHAWDDHWNSTFGMEQPDIYVDVNSGPNPGGSTLTRVPDFGLNTRYERAGFGHLQASTMLRDLGAKDSLGDDHHVLGWGVNLSAGLDLSPNDYLQLLGVYGHGVGGMGNDTSFLNSDAAFDSDGDLEALPYWSAMFGYTHRWCEVLRSTVSYGYVNLDTASGQAATFYHESHYASANVIWQLRKRLSVGLEGLYGIKEARNGNDSGDHWRMQLGMVYSLFD